jgi:predicted homoserine dehydrogenase-like protein
VPAGKPVTWGDVAIDADSAAVRLRREMEAAFRARERHAA